MKATVATFVPVCGELLWIDLFMLVNTAPGSRMVSKGDRLMPLAFIWRSPRSFAALACWRPWWCYSSPFMWMSPAFRSFSLQESLAGASLAALAGLVGPLDLLSPRSALPLGSPSRCTSISLIYINIYIYPDLQMLSLTSAPDKKEFHHVKLRRGISRGVQAPMLDYGRAT